MENNPKKKIIKFLNIMESEPCNSIDLMYKWKEKKIYIYIYNGWYLCKFFFFLINYKLVLERLSYLFLFILGGSQFFF